MHSLPCKRQNQVKHKSDHVTSLPETFQWLPIAPRIKFKPLNSLSGPTRAGPVHFSNQDSALILLAPVQQTSYTEQLCYSQWHALLLSGRCALPKTHSPSLCLLFPSFRSHTGYHFLGASPQPVLNLLPVYSHRTLWSSFRINHLEF